MGGVQKFGFENWAVVGSISTHKKKNEVDLGERPAEIKFDLKLGGMGSIARHKGKNYFGVKGSSLLLVKQRANSISKLYSIYLSPI